MQRLQLGRVMAESEGRLDVLVADGTRQQVKRNQVLLSWDAPESPGTEAQVRERGTALAAHAAQIPLDTLAERVAPGEIVTLDRLASLLATLPTDAANASAPAVGTGDPWLRAALCLALAHDHERFRREDHGYAVLDPEERARRRARAAEVREAERWTELAHTWGPELEHGRWSGAASPYGPEFLRRLRSLAALERHSPHWKSLGKALGLHQHGEASVAHRLKPWLVVAGAWPGWPALWLERAEVAQAFPPHVLDEAVRLAAKTVDVAGRVDRRQAGNCFTLDAISTFDYDDAYSVESGAGGVVACVHIAEPPAELAPGHAVFEEAARRLSSVYTEAGVYPMLPPALSLGRCSLLRGVDREVLSFRFRVEPEGLTWLGLERSVIAVDENLDYARGSALALEFPDTWGLLAQACEAQAKAREKRGALLTERKDLQLDPSQPERVRLAVVRRSGPGQRIVEELAVAFNAAAGAYCRQHRIPALYRVQQRVSVPSVGSSLTPGGAVGHARFSTHGAPHDGLACERYVQATSPNRRFPDLVMQRQLVAHALGKPPPFDAQQLLAWGNRVEARLSAYEEAERFIQQHWVRVYLTQNPGTVAVGTVRRRKPDATLVWLDELELQASAPADLAATPGQSLRFRVTAVDVDLQHVEVVTVE
jgi:hypothetical protein